LLQAKKTCTSLFETTNTPFHTASARDRIKDRIKCIIADDRKLFKFYTVINVT
jgi:hypothetical protein